MGSVKLAVSLPESLVERLASTAARNHVPRSKVIAEAVSEYLERLEVVRLRELINAAYADGPDAEERATLNAAVQLQRERSVEDW